MGKAPPFVKGAAKGAKPSKGAKAPKKPVGVKAAARSYKAGLDKADC